MSCALLLLLLAAPAQDPQPSEPNPTQRAQLSSLLDLSLRADPVQADELIAQIESALAEVPRCADPLVLKTRSQLATLALHASRPRLAELHFREVVERSGDDQPDLRGRALYGLAQAHELLDESATAERYARRLLAEHEGTRYADYARILLGRLERERALDAPRTGQPAPRFEPVLDLLGRAWTLEALLARDRRAVLMVFWRPDSAESIRRLAQLAEIWARAGHTETHCLAFALERDKAAVEDSVRKHGLTMPVVHCDAQFSHPVAARYGVGAVPSDYLIGPGGVVLARNAPLRRLQKILEELGRER
jgi:hypothetical protein